MLLRGECFTYITGRSSDGRIAKFVAAPPDDIGVEWIDGHYEYLISGNPVDAADIIHIRCQSLLGRTRGISPLEWVGRSMTTSAGVETPRTSPGAAGSRGPCSSDEATWTRPSRPLQSCTSYLLFVPSGDLQPPA